MAVPKTLQPIVTKSEESPARAPISVLEHTSVGPEWVCTYVEEEQLWPPPEPDEIDCW